MSDSSLMAFMKYAVDAQESFGACGLTMDGIDGMTGLEFETACAYLLLCDGFTDVELTPATGDYGVDIIARKGVESWAVQCKRSSVALGNPCVQQVHAGKEFYHCNKAVVMTNSMFTPRAAKLASQTGVELWDRTVLLDMLTQM